MDRLAKLTASLKEHYEIVVVGSGYGGGVAASRLARAGRSVCLLERGREIHPGEYPDSLKKAAKEFQADVKGKSVGSPTGLFDIRVNDNINVVLGCGLGGTSLINANASLKAEPWVFQDPCWPQTIRDEAATDGLEPYYQKAMEMLQPVAYPAEQPDLNKLQAHAQSADALRQQSATLEFSRPPINVTFQNGINQVGVEQKTCNGCGDCCSGCNYWSKNTTLMNYIPDAHNHGAEIFTGIQVRRLAQEGDRWLIYYQRPGVGRKQFDGPEMFISADIVILAAGTLGSAEILLRSKAQGLALSDHLGQGFTGNGDVLAFAYNCDREINGIGFGDKSANGREPVGPCITGLIDMRKQEPLDQGMVIEEGSLPGAISSLLSGAFAAGSKAFGVDTDDGLLDDTREGLRELDSLIRGAYKGAMRNTQTFLVMTHDGQSGHMILDQDRLRINWPDIGEHPIFQQVSDRLLEATTALGGTYLKNPIWTDFLGKRLVTVHPLGGCGMAESAENGVVNHKGQVFSSNNGDQVYAGLYVCDGAVMPRSLGVNPLLTITALAERNMARLAEDRSWVIDYTESAQLRPGRKPKLGLSFTEKMAGFIGQGEDFQSAAQQGKQANTPLQFILTIETDDLETMLADPNYGAGLAGTVRAPSLSSEPLSVSHGRFNLFTKDPDQPTARKMLYAMQLHSKEGRHLQFAGFKVMRDDPGPDIWPDTTTLYVTLTDLANDTVITRGILRIKPLDFARQVTTLHILNAESKTQALKAKMRFGDYFAGNLFQTYFQGGNEE